MSTPSSQAAKRTADASSALQALTRFFASATDRIGAHIPSSQAGMQASYSRDPPHWVPPPPPASQHQQRGFAYGRKSYDLPPTPESSMRDELMHEIRTDLQSFVEEVQKHVTDEVDRVKKQVLTSITKASRPSEEAVKLIKSDDEHKKGMEEKLVLLEKDSGQNRETLERLGSRLDKDRDAFSRNATLWKTSVEKQYKTLSTSVEALGTAVQETRRDHFSSLAQMVAKISEEQSGLAKALEETQTLFRKFCEMSSELLYQSQLRKRSPFYQRHVATSRARALPSQGHEAQPDSRERLPAVQTSCPSAKKRKRHIEVDESDVSDG